MQKNPRVSSPQKASSLYFLIKSVMIRVEWVTRKDHSRDNADDMSFAKHLSGVFYGYLTSGSMKRPPAVAQFSPHIPGNTIIS